MGLTKIASKIRIPSDVKKKINEEQLKENYIAQTEMGIDSYEELFDEIEELYENNEAIHFEDNNYIFYPKLLLLMIKENSIKVGSNKIMDDLEDFTKNSLVRKKWKMSLLTETEVRSIFFEYSKENRLFGYKNLLCRDDRLENEFGFIIGNDKFLSTKKVVVLESGTIYSKSTRRGPFIGLGIPLYTNISSVRIPKGYRFNREKYSNLQILIEIGGIPAKLKSKEMLKNLVDLVNQKYITINEDRIKITEKGISAIQSGKCSQIGKKKISKDLVLKNNQQKYNKTIDISKMNFDEKASTLSYYAECDCIRANINLYDLSWLEDPNQGHWELWEGNEGEDLINLSPGNKIYARNPKFDIRGDCIVGIDFGTKSTVVVCQNETGIIRPMPIGSGDIRKKLGNNDFENPTVMQFIDFASFLKDYLDDDGRPYTRWKDLIVSHSANESMKDTGVRSSEFYSYLYDLKQWTGEGRRVINLRDKNGNDLLLAAYDEIDKTDKDQIDPIEIYAYYIGLYINNMNNGIYLDYLLSFPVTYEKNTRESILKSFERGLKKSLPQSIIDDDIISKFNVVSGASEPAAYAICALEEYGFYPEENENVFYGIFDFGGGTADFDFGLWTKSKDEDLFDYCIEHFGTQGDRYLGGENLLQLIAFEVFVENIDLCRRERIPFAKPIEMINIQTSVLGFVNDSQEARMNQKLMMEKIRPFWEHSNGNGEEMVDINEFNEFQIGLFNVDGILKSNLAFEVDIEKLNKILKNRIEKGVKQFFESLKDTFTSKHIRKTGKVDSINIFLAGNSSKSPILKEVFQKYIDEWDRDIKNIRKNGDDFSHFILFPPLGTEEAIRIQQDRGIVYSNQLEAPTGKTGVAWGLIEGREGGRIEVIEEVAFDSETKFTYYLGILKGKNFFMKIHRDEPYFKWIKFLPSKRKINEILFTSLPEATGGKLLSNETGVFRKRIEIPYTREDSYIYIKLVSANSIEYAIGDSEGNVDESSIKQENF